MTKLKNWERKMCDRARQQRARRAEIAELLAVTLHPNTCPRCGRDTLFVEWRGQFSVTCKRCGVAWGGSATLLRYGAASRTR